MTKNIRVRPGLLTHIPDMQQALYEKALYQFIEHNSHGANLEKLHTGTKAPLYSIRVNKEARLILTPVKRNNEQVWLWVDILDQHQYNALSKINNHWLAQHIANTLEHDIEVTLTAAVEGPAPDLPPIYLESGIEFHDKHFILFDEHQKKAIEADMPLLISGAPGSGKSSVALSLLRHYLTTNPPIPGESKQLLYVAESPALVKTMEQEWKEIQAVEGLNPEEFTIRFRTPQQLFDEYYRERQETPPLRAEPFFFNNWLADYAATELSLISHAGPSTSKKKKIESPEETFLHYLAAHPELVYQEFRTLSGYSTFSEYNKNVGSKHSLFAEEKERNALWNAYHRYHEALTAQNRVDLVFHPLQVNKQMDVLVADEAQDLSRLQLRSLDKLVANHHLAYCIGDHQRVHDSRSIVPFIKSIFWELNQKELVTHLPLSASYRCPEQVIQLANAILQLKYYLTGGLDKNELMFVHPSEHLQGEGSVHWLENEEDLKPLLNDKNNADFAVITSPEFKAEAEERFGAERVFTPEEIKGLQYKHVLFYKLLDQDGYKEANKMIDDQFTLHSNPEGVPLGKASNSSISHSTVFNELFVAATRAQTSVSIYQPEQRTIHRLRNVLKQFVQKYNTNQVHVQAIPTNSSSEEWAKRAEMLKAQEKNDKAEKIAARFIETKQPIKVQEHRKKTTKVNKEPATIMTKPTPVPRAVPKTTRKESPIITSKIYDIMVRIKHRDTTAIKDLLEHQHAHECLFTTPYSLYLWITNNGMTEHLVNTIIALLDEMFQSGNTPQQRINDFMDLLCNIDGSSTLSVEKSSLLALLLGHKELDASILIFLKNQIAKEQLDQFLTQSLNKLSLLEFSVKVARIDLLDRIHILRNLQDLRDDDGSTVAHYAAYYNQLRVLIRLHQLNINLNTQNKKLLTPLTMAAIEGNSLAISLLHRFKIDINAENNNGATAVHFAALLEQKAALHTLKELGADLNICSATVGTPAYAVVEKNLEDMFDTLHELGADVSIANADGNNPTHIAAKKNYNSILLKFKEFGLDPNPPNKKGERPIHCAAEMGHTNTVNTLIKLGINLDVTDNEGNAAVHFAAENDQLAMLVLLHKKGANLNLKDNNGRSIIHLIVNQGYTLLITQLKEFQVDLNAKDNLGDTAAHLAAMKGDIKSLIQLHLAGADLNIENAKGYTPADFAIAESHEKIIEQLSLIGIKMSTNKINFTQTKNILTHKTEPQPKNIHAFFPELPINKTAPTKKEQLEHAFSSS